MSAILSYPINESFPGRDCPVSVHREELLLQLNYQGSTLCNHCLPVGVPIARLRGEDLPTGRTGSIQSFSELRARLCGPADGYSLGGSANLRGYRVPPAILARVGSRTDLTETAFILIHPSIGSHHDIGYALLSAFMWWHPRIICQVEMRAAGPAARLADADGFALTCWVGGSEPGAGLFLLRAATYALGSSPHLRSGATRANIQI